MEGGRGGGGGRDVVKHNVLPKAQTLCEYTHRLQGFFFYSLFISFLSGQFKKKKKKKERKTENTGVLCALMF